MRKLLATAICAVALAPAAFAQGAAAFNHQTLAGQSGPVTGKPISADEVRRTVQVLADGSHIEHSETDHFYRDAQGRMRTETPTGAVIFDPVAGCSYDVTNNRKSYTKMAASAGAVVTIAAQAHQSSISSHTGSASRPSPGTTEDLPVQSINGILAKGTRTTITIPVGAIGNDRELKTVNERWYSDDLKLLVKSSNVDPRFGTTTYELTNILQQPPDPTLFQPPSDYTLSTGH